MLQSLRWAALGTGFTFGMTTLGAALVFFLAGEPHPRFQRALLGFAAGVMTAASVWSLLLPAIDQASQGALPGWVPAAGGMLTGVAFLAALDALLPRLRRGRQAMTASWRQTTLLMTAITLH
ncbi:MAG: ZIP family metal transporter, partial [Dysosmobacter sp.]|nr:ZIP family metal transporter [Dysosmobacter sp.]